MIYKLFSRNFNILINSKPAIRYLHSNLSLLKQTSKFNNQSLNVKPANFRNFQLNLVLRRNRSFFGKKGDSKNAESVKVKIKLSEIKRLLSLAEPDKYKLAGI